MSAGDTGPLLWSPTSFGATQQACVKLAAIDGNADDIALVLKAQSNTGLGNGLMEVLYDPTPGAIRIWTYDTTNDWVQRGSDLSASFAAGDTLRVVARSNGQVEIYKNTTLLGTRDASAWTYSAQGGYIGLLSYNGPNTLFDDFGGGTYAGASGPARADDPQPVAKALRQPAERRIAERHPAEQQPAEQHPAAFLPVVADLGRVAERAAQAVADIQARAHTWGLRPAAAQPEPKGAAALFAPVQRAPLAVTPVSPIAGEVFRLYVSAGARPVAVRSIAAGGATSVQYLHPDHLGSIGQITDQARNWVQDVYFKPYGGVRWSQEPGGTGPDSDSATRRSYTGQYEETSQWMGSLMHYKARYYSPYLNRWLQPDTVVPNPGNPQDLNRYLYVLGNPTSAIDPTGHNCVGPVCLPSPEQWKLIAAAGAALAAAPEVAMVGAIGLGLMYIGASMIADSTSALPAYPLPEQQGPLSTSYPIPGSSTVGSRLENPIGQVPASLGHSTGIPLGSGGQQISTAFPIPAPQPIGSNVTAIGGNTLDTARGIQEHNVFTDEVRSRGNGWIANQKIPGWELRPDAYNPNTGEVIEYKPNNPRAIREGWRQIKTYINALSESFDNVTTWTGTVQTYDK